MPVDIFTVLLVGFILVFMVIGLLARLIFPLFMGLLILRQFRKFQAEVARQQQWLNAHLQQLATQPDFQDELVRRLGKWESQQNMSDPTKRVWRTKELPTC